MKDLIAVNERPTNCEFTGRFRWSAPRRGWVGVGGVWSRELMLTPGLSVICDTYMLCRCSCSMPWC